MPRQHVDNIRQRGVAGNHLVNSEVTHATRTVTFIQINTAHISLHRTTDTNARHILLLTLHNLPDRVAITVQIKRVK